MGVNSKSRHCHQIKLNVHGTRAKIDQVDAIFFVEQRLNNVVIKVQ